MKQLMLVILTFSFTSGCALSQLTDDLRARIKSDGIHDTTRILWLADLAYRIQSANPDSATYYACFADSLSKELNYDKGRGKALRVIGNVFTIKGDYAKAVSVLDSAARISEKAGDVENMSKCYGNLGSIYASQGVYEKALSLQSMSLSLNERLNNKRGVAHVYNNIAYIYEAQGNKDKALEYLFYSLELLLEIGDEYSIAVAEQNLGVMYKEKKEFNEAYVHHAKAVEIFERLNDKHGLMFSYANLADLCIASGNLREVKEYLGKALAVGREIKSIDGVSFVHELYAKYYYSTNDFELSLTNAISSQALAKQSGDLQRWRDASKQRYLASKALEKHEEALENYQVFITLRDSLKNEEIHKRLLSMDFSLKEAKMRMDQERKELQYIVEREKQKRSTITIAVLVSICIGIGLYVLYRIWKDRTRREIMHMREKVARDLHDNMGSNLSTINILTNVVMNELMKPRSNLKVVDILDKISHLSSHAMESVDDIVWSLNPLHDSFEQIIMRMRLLGGQVLEDQGINFIFYSEGDPAKCQLDIERRNDLYLIYKESITNISKYAKCRNVYTNLSVYPGNVQLVIADDGIGFSNTISGNGNGLQNIRARSKNLNGILTIKSELTKGTRIELNFPVRTRSVA
jgi:two-component system, NarL family, sensor histidine kinase UhpB